MKHLSLLILILTLLAFPLSAHAQDVAASDVTITKVRDNIHMLISPQGGNVTLSTGEDGNFIIDDQLTGREAIIETAIKTINDDAIQFILNTHYHFDHTGGNEAFGAKDAIIVAHDNVRQRLSTKQFITFFNKELPPLAKAGLPVVTFSDGMSLHYNGDDIQIIHVPNAHTDGDSIAHFTNENVIVAGDTIFNNMYPFIDTEHGGSIKGMIAALDMLLELAGDDTLIIPGHGPLMNKSDLQTYRQSLSTISESIETAIKEGKTLAQTLAAKPTAEFDDIMGGGFINPDTFVTVLYEDLSRK